MICETEPTIGRFLQEAMVDEQERRQLHRKPFLRQAEIILPGEPATSAPAFCRDISRSGIGLLHERPLDVGDEFELTIPLLGKQLELHCTLEWCSCLGETQYLSGSRYRCATKPQSLFLVSAVVGEKLNRRLHRRFPLFRPVVLNSADGQQTAAFSRDVSQNGIGLVHRYPITAGHTVITMQSSFGTEIVAETYIERCVVIGQGWYSSGGCFSSDRKSVR